MVSAVDDIVDSINETVRKYCADGSESSPTKKATVGTGSTPSTSAEVPSPTASRLQRDISVSPCGRSTLDHGSPSPNSVSSMSLVNNDNDGEVSFASLAKQVLTATSEDRRPMEVSVKPASVDVAVQVNPVDFHLGDGRAEIGIQAGGDEVPTSGNDGSLNRRCCPYCHSQLPADDEISPKDDETPSSNSVSVPTNDNGTHPLSGAVQSVATLSAVPAVSNPANVPSFVQCSLSLGDSYHYSPTHSHSSVAADPIRIFPSNGFSSSGNIEAGSPVPAQAVSACVLPINTPLIGNMLGSDDGQGGQNWSSLLSDGFASLPNAGSQPVSESSLVNLPVVTFSVTPEAARLPGSTDSGGQLSNTSLSNITLSDLLPSMQGSIPLELLVNQTDGFTMYTEIVPVSEPCHVDPLSSVDLPASGSSCAGAGISDVAVSHHESWSPTQLVSQQSPVNMMVCLPISSVSSPSLSSFLSQHKSLSSFAGDAATSRPPTPGTLAPGDAIEAVAIAVVPPDEDLMPKPAENYSIHRIVETCALKQQQAGDGEEVGDCSWSSSNTGLLFISRPDIAAVTRSAALSDCSVNEEPHHRQLADNDGFHGDQCDRSCHGDDSDTHDDICVIDSDRDVIVIDGDDEVVRPNVPSDAAAAAAGVSERTSRVGRHGRRRRQQMTAQSQSTAAAGRLSQRRPLTSSVPAVNVDDSDHSTSLNCLDNGFVETSPSSAALVTDAEPRHQPETQTLVIHFALFTCTKEVMFSLALVCLFVS